MVELRYTTQINQFAMFYIFFAGHDLIEFGIYSQYTIYNPDQPIRNIFQVVELRSTTQINQFAMFLKWLTYDLRPRSVTYLCFISGWAMIYDPDQPIRNVF